MKKSSFRLKPGQLCTINKHVYQATKIKSENIVRRIFYGNVCKISACSECEKVNKVHCISIVKGFPYPCYKIFGHLMYPKLIK